MRLVSSQAICDLLSENTDEHVNHFILFTNYGTIIAHDGKLDWAKLNKFTALTGLVWRTNDDRSELNKPKANPASTIHSTGYDIGVDAWEKAPPYINPFGDNLVVRKLVIASEVTRKSGDDTKGKKMAKTARLHQAILEMDGDISVVRLVTPRLLIAAQMPISRLSQSQPDSKTSSHEPQIEEYKARDRSGSQDDIPVDNGGSSDVDTTGGIFGEDALAAQNSNRNKCSDLAAPNGVKSNRPLRSSTKGHTTCALRVLELKAEGMAEFIADEYPDKLPHDFY